MLELIQLLLDSAAALPDGIALVLGDHPVVVVRRSEHQPLVGKAGLFPQLGLLSLTQYLSTAPTEALDRAMGVSKTA